MGYGKTVLLSRWGAALRARGGVVAWVTCEPQDDMHSLWAAVASAIAIGMERATPPVAAHPEEGSDGRAPSDAEDALGPGARRWHEIAQPPAGVEPSFLGTVAGVLQAQQTPVVLVLDDAHTITDPETRASITELLEQRSQRLTIVLAARHDPLVDLSRLRLGGDLHEVRADGLACTRDEADQMLRAAGTPLSPSALALVHARTEGWPAGLRLMGLALSGLDDPDGLVDDFATDHRVVADYLVTSLLGRLPDASRRLLRRTSIVGAVTGELATALTGAEDAGLHLERLERQGALVTRLGRAGRWYRYHALLRAYLVADLRATDLPLYRHLHAAASRWYLAQGHQLPALEHAVQAADPRLVDDVVCGVGPELLLGGAGDAVRRALGSLPAPPAPSPVVAAVLALAEDDPGVRLPGRSAPARVPLPRPGPPTGHPPDRKELLLLAAALRDDGVTSLPDPVAPSVLALVPPDPVAPAGAPTVGPPAAAPDDDVRALLLRSAAPHALASGDAAGARRLFRHAADLAEVHGYHQLRLEALTGLAATSLAAGDARAAEAEAACCLQFAQERGWAEVSATRPSRDVAVLAAVLAGAPQPGGDDEPEQPAGGPDLPTTATSLLGLTASVLQADQPARRREALSAARAWWDAGGTGAPWEALLATYAEVVGALASGSPARAKEVADEAGARGVAHGDHLVLQALVLLRQDDLMASDLVADAFAGGQDAPVHPLLAMCGHLVQACSASRHGRTAAADGSTLKALGVAGSTGVVLPFARTGPECRTLLQGLHGRAGRLDGQVRTVLTWLPKDFSPRGDVVVDLTAREHDVLRELPSLLHMSEIAERQQVSLNTVKTHVRSVYRKLGVSDRRGAVDAARRLQLL